MGYEAINYRICHENISSLILIRGSPKRAPADLFSVSLGHSKFCSSGVRWLPGKAAESATNKKNSEEKKRTETTETTNTEAEHSLATTTTKSISSDKCSYHIAMHASVCRLSTSILVTYLYLPGPLQVFHWSNTMLLTASAPALGGLSSVSSYVSEYLLGRI